MKLFPSVLRRKRGVIFFVAAFILPLFFVVVVSIDTFSKRQTTTRNLLESNLWLAGRSAFDQMEAQFIEIEEKWLNAEYFSSILRGDSLELIDTNPGMFLIDQEFQLVYPVTAEDRDTYSLTFNRSWNSDYRKYMGRAEAEELARRNFSNAATHYLAGLGVAETPQQEALAIEGLARCNMVGQNYQQAIRYYQLLKNEYSQTGNLGGRPYGISAPLQLHTIGTLTREEVFGHDSLLATYHLIRDGNWLISSSSYLFFKSAYESLLNIEIESEASRFESILQFNQFLGDFVIPAIKERSGFSEFNKAGETRRTYMQTGDAQYLLKPGNLAEVVRNTLDSYRYHFVKKGFRIEEEIDRDIPAVLFDKEAVEGILINLFSNAIKFSKETKKMAVRLEETPEAICLVVADKGIGIPPDELSNIFNRFYRVKSTTDFEARGSGLGLTLVKHVIDAHACQIGVESTPEQGSVFSILIPHNPEKED